MNSFKTLFGIISGSIAFLNFRVDKESRTSLTLSRRPGGTCGLVTLEGVKGTKSDVRLIKWLFTILARALVSKQFSPTN